ncbi:MAG: HNH endonuclease signature motif containing protein [Acetobacteraceae bacterium]
MNRDDDGATESDLPARVAEIDPELVARSVVDVGMRYPEYRQHLRHDFFFSCAYCTMAEAEAQGIRMTIDHYEPRSARRDLENDYANLMYACDQCNMLKGDRCPTPQARENGHRFFRPDQDVRRQHFAQSGIRLNSKTNVADFSIEAMDLNRHSLLRLRQIRNRVAGSVQEAAEGIMALRRLPIDRLPLEIKGKVVTTLQHAISAERTIAETIDSVLRERARSPLIDPDPEAEAHTRERIGRLEQMEALHPGAWRQRRDRTQRGRRNE